MNKLNICIIAILLVVVAGAFYWQSATQDKLDRVEQNYRAANDSIKVLVLKNHELLYEKEAYILKESELQSHIDITEEEIKEMKKKLKSSIDYITKIEGALLVDTIYTNDTVYIHKDTTFINFDYNDLWLSLNGTTKLIDCNAETTINKLIVPITLETGLTENYSIFVKTDNPYVNVVGLNGAIIDDTKFRPKFHHELQIGIGFQYGLFNRNVDFGPQIGYGFIIEF